MKIKYILITVGSMLLLWGLLSFAEPSIHRNPQPKKVEIIISVIGLGALLTGIFWKK